MDDVESEIMVQSQHQNIHRTPRAILEVRRILIQHLSSVRTEPRWAERLQEGVRVGSLPSEDRIESGMAIQRR